jgi:hypothetical protein
MKTEIRIWVIKCYNSFFLNIQGNKRKYTNLNSVRISKTWGVVFKGDWHEMFKRRIQ